jgi:UDPglucose 6-dehydrogenase
MKRIAVLGTGYVGLVTGACFADIGNEVVCCDIDPDKIERLKRGEAPIYEPGLEELIRRNLALGRLRFTLDAGQAIRSAEIVFITVGTPMSAGGEPDLTAIREVSATIGRHLDAPKVIAVKSTVPVGTCRQVEAWIREHRPDPSVPFDVVANPEFLREGSAVEDCMQMERAIIGTDDLRAAGVIAELYAPFNTRVQITGIESAEMIKYASNAFLATKISFINAIANICERVGADVVQVAEGMGSDSRIGPQFLQAGVGYGGSCFPKDTEALWHIARRSGCEFPLIRTVIEMNLRQRTVVLDKLRAALGDLEDRTIAVLGLSFKPNTDDIRCAPSLDIIPKIVQAGGRVKAYDPKAMAHVRRELGTHRIDYAAHVYDAVNDADACVILTEWEEIAGMDLRAVRYLMNRPILVDGRNCLDIEQARRLGFDYYAIGRPAVSTGPRGRPQPQRAHAAV